MKIKNSAIYKMKLKIALISNFLFLNNLYF